MSAARTIAGATRRSDDPRELAAGPPIRLLTDAEWKHAQEIAERYKLSLPPRAAR